MATEASSGRRAIDLPSFNLSNYINIGEGQTAKDLLEQLKFKGQIKTIRDEQPQQGAPALQMTNGTAKGKGNRISTRHKREFKIGLDAEMADQILQGPKLLINVPNEYSRFRYESEKTKDKKRKRNYETDDTDKQCLLDIQLTDYTGTAKVICYCCDEKGRIHPFSLFGDRGCHHGVYVSRHKFKPQQRHRLTGVSVVMPTKGKKEEAFMVDKISYLENELHLSVDIKRDDKHDKQLVHVRVVVQLEDDRQTILSGISTALNNRKQGKEFLIDDVEPNRVLASGNPPNNLSKNRVLVVVSNQTYFPNEPAVVLRQRDASGNTMWEKVLVDQLEVVKKAVVKFIAPPYLDPDIENDVEVELCLRDNKTNKETKPWPFFYLGSDLYDMKRKTKKRKLADDDHAGTPTEYSEDNKEFKRKAVSVYNGQYQEGASRPLEMMGENSNSSETQNVMVLGTELSSPALTSRSLPFSTYTPMSPQPGAQSFQELLGSTTSSSMPPRPPSAGFKTTDQSQTIIITSDANSYQLLDGQPDKYLVQAVDEQEGQTEASNNVYPPFTIPALGPNQQLAIINGQWIIINNDLEEISGQSAVPTPPVPAPSLPDHNFQKPMSAQLNQAQRSDSQSARNSAPLQSTELSTTPSMNLLISSGLQAIFNSLSTQQQPQQQQQQQAAVQQQQQQLTTEQMNAFLQGLLNMYQSQLGQSGVGASGNTGGMAQSQSNNSSVMSDSDLETDGAPSEGNRRPSQTRGGKMVYTVSQTAGAVRQTRGKKMPESMSRSSNTDGSCDDDS